MSATMHIDIVSAEKQIYSGRAELVTASGELGELGVTPGHSQLLTKLKPGLVRVRVPDQGEEIFYISGGILEVQPYLVTVLADTAERAKDLDEAEAQEAMEKAKQLLSGKQAEVDYAKALAEVANIAAQLRAIRALRDKLK